MKLRRLKMRRKFLFGQLADRGRRARIDAIGRRAAVIAGDRLRRSKRSSQNDKCRARKENCDRLAHEKYAFQDDMTAPVSPETKDAARLLSMRWTSRYQYQQMLNRR
ncbi:hypothetical protein LJR235_004062 [Pararhizobium sp. LjRoot235]|uniref:hypothetical protein n=1 Tax=Pararhizobium sp. LjRoot235 TaxID=3342291 RepID=UPI003ECCC4BC